jgi:PAS domain S-box-containing protein
LQEKKLMRWQYTPYTFPILIAAAVSIILALSTWQRRTAPGSKAFALLTLLLAEWLVGYALELGGVDLTTKIFWAKIQYLGIVCVPLLWLAFALQFTQQEKWLTRRNWLLAGIIPLITLLLIWTNEFHGLIWRRTGLATNGPFPGLDVSYGAWFWVHLAFSYISVLLGTIVFMRVLIRFPYLYRRQAGLLLIGVLAPWISNGIYIFGLTPIPNLDLTPFAFTISVLAFGWSLFQFRLLDLVPIARRAVVEGMSDGVIVLDTQNRIVDLNPAAQQIINRNATQAIGKTVTQELSTWPEFIAGYYHITEGQMEIVNSADKTQRYFDMRISALYDQRKRLTGRLIVLRDITERKQKEEALALAHEQALAASRLKTELLAKVSHELRTPLSAILGFTEMLEVGVYGSLSQRQQQATAEIMGSTFYLISLVNELLDQAQLDAGKLKLNLNLFAPADLLESTMSKMKVLAQAKGLTLTTTIAPDMPASLCGDQARIQQILVNLVGNAIKFTPTGTVQVSLYQPNSAHWAIQVSDTGPGIPFEAQADIFEPFSQVDGSMTRRHNGTGLGLSIVKQLVILMDGQITLKSKVGEGSTFLIVFPLQFILEQST